MTKNVNVWVLTGQSESGDSYGPEMFEKKPTKKKISEWVHSRDGSPDKEGPGFDGSWVHIELTKRKINQMKKADEEWGL